MQYDLSRMLAARIAEQAARLQPPEVLVVRRDPLIEVHGEGLPALRRAVRDIIEARMPAE